MMIAHIQSKKIRKEGNKMDKKNLILDIIITAAIIVLGLLMFAAPKSTAVAVALYMRRAAALLFTIALWIAYGKIVDKYDLGIYAMYSGCLLILMFMSVLATGTV